MQSHYCVTSLVQLQMHSKQKPQTNRKNAKKFYPTYLVDVIDTHTASAEVAKNSTPCREKIKPDS